MPQERFKQELPMISSANSGENPCFSCGACCKNNWFDVMSDDELVRMSNGAPYVNELLPDLNDPNDFQNRINVLSYKHEEKISDPEINFTRLPFPGFVRVSQIGVCPQLDSDNKCQIYNTRPVLCANLKVGGDECNKRRGSNGLSKIDESGQVIIPDSLGKRFFKIIQSLFSK
jgi:Fe-S-cluster containining protein